MTLPIDLAANEYPNRLAFDDGRSQITYADLGGALLKSTVMQRTDLQAGDRIAWCPNNDVDAFTTFWAVQRRGCVACPISHRWPEQKRRDIVAGIDAIWLENPTSSAEGASDTIENVAQRATATDPQQQDSQQWDPQCPATLILTSGSTGVPKAVVHSLAAHVANATGAAQNMPLLPGDRWLWSLPLCHVSGLSILIRCAVAGATTVGVAAGTKITAELLERLQISHISVVPTQLRRLLAESRFPGRQLKSVLLGGASVDTNLVREARQRGISLFTTYGADRNGLASNHVDRERRSGRQRTSPAGPRAAVGG